MYDEWWRIGFDCGHSDDLLPYTIMNNSFNNHYNLSNSVIYRDMQFVESEIKSIVDQIDIINNGLISRLDKRKVREEKLKELVG